VLQGIAKEVREYFPTYFKYIPHYFNHNSILKTNFWTERIFGCSLYLEDLYFTPLKQTSSQLVKDYHPKIQVLLTLRCLILAFVVLCSLPQWLITTK